MSGYSRHCCRPPAPTPDCVIRRLVVKPHHQQTPTTVTRDTKIQSHCPPPASASCPETLSPTSQSSAKKGPLETAHSLSPVPPSMKARVFSLLLHPSLPRTLPLLHNPAFGITQQTARMASTVRPAKRVQSQRKDIWSTVNEAAASAAAAGTPVVNVTPPKPPPSCTGVN